MSPAAIEWFYTEELPTWLINLYQIIRNQQHLAPDACLSILAMSQ